MLNIAIRNCKVFLRDRASVLYSFLAVFIIIGLYVLFLGDMMKRSIQDMPGGGFLMDSWIMAGMIAASTFTTTLGSLGTMVEDRAYKIRKDFDASPLRRSTIAGGYMLSAMLLGLLLCVTTLILAEVYIVLNGGELLSVLRMLQAFGVMALSVLASSGMLFFVVSFIKSNNAYGGLSTVAGTLVGFLTGIYIPIGSLPSAVQTFIKFFPTAHAAALLRQIMMAAPSEIAFAGAPASELIAIQEELGVIFRYGSYTAPAWLHILVLAGTAAVFFGLSVWRVFQVKGEA